VDATQAPKPPGRIRTAPEDFVVEELSAYAPTGAGQHVFVRFTKTNLTTLAAVQSLARSLACDPRAAGFAGMKDKVAVTTQTVSLEAPTGVDAADLAKRALSLSLEGIAVHEAIPHGHKLKPGHLQGNRFAIAVRGVPRDRLRDVTSGLDGVARRGLPNAFGTQRFGARGDNAERALAWLRDPTAPAPRDKRLARLLWSSLQSKVYNEVLDARVRDGTWNVPIEGDLLKLRSSGGLFECADVATDRERAERGEVSPTGPMIGARMRWPGGAAQEMERDTVQRVLGAGFDLERTRPFGEGSRRALRLWVQDLRFEIDEADAENAVACVRVYFVLPKGAYATTVLASIWALDAPRGPGGPRGNDDEEEEPE